MNVRLQLRYHAELPRSAAAWLIPGANPRTWLDELIAWNVPLGQVRLHALPRGPEETSAAAVLAVLVSGAKPSVTPRAQGYALLAGRLYVPLESHLEPPVSERELSELLPAEEEIYLWHPVAGLICFPRQTALRVADLLAAPRIKPAAWDCAVPGTAVNCRLHSLEPGEPIDLTFVLREGGDDIGTQASDLKQLPPSPRERQASPLSGAANAARAAIAKTAALLASLVPHTASQRTWINDLEDWAGRTLNRYSDWLRERQHKELARLLDMLTHEPDEGLKYALPLARGDHRGLAPPGANLVRHDVSFNLNQLNGGGPADFWHVPADFHSQLMTRYRELANREIALGRHRRAAYIFAQLLDDLPAAAVTLANGGHYREAAALYRERLGQPYEAANCLRRGGFWPQAIELYEQLGQHEVVGSLYRQLDEPESADAAYRRAVEEHIKGMHYLKAAQLLEQELSRPREAQECLLRGWPYSGQAEQCLAEVFKLLARHAEHDQALAHVNTLPETVVTSDRVVLLAGVLAETAGSYPDVRVRQAAADRTRVLAAGSLDLAAPNEIRSLTDSLRRLVPEDRLLARDCQRFVAAREQQPPVAAPAARGSREDLKLLKEIRLGEGDWRACVSSGNVFFAAGYRDDEVLLVRGLPDGTIHQPHGKPWRVHGAMVGNLILLACDPQPGAQRVFVNIACSLPLQYDRPFPPRAGFHDPVVAGPSRGFNPTILAMHYDRGHLRSLHFTQDSRPMEFVVTCVDPEGQLISTRNFDGSLLMDDKDRGGEPAILACGGLVCAGIGARLHVLNGQRHDVVETPSAIRSLAGSLPHGRIRIIAALEQGGLFFPGDPARVAGRPFAEELHQPVVGLTSGGYLIAASREEIQVYETYGGRLRFRTQIKGLGVPPIAVVTTARSNQFIVAHANGHLLVYQVPPSASG